MSPTFNRERRAIADGHIVCGIDEAGRGPWAGPVVAAAIILDPRHIPKGLNDSKKLSDEKRESLFQPIMESAQVGIGIIDAPRIDAINILRATFEAMIRAVTNLPQPPTLALVDGNRKPPLNLIVRTLIKGDGKCLSIAAASIIAKVTRDRLMHQYDGKFPHYGFAQHKGYGTEAHAAALAKLGPCSLHRMSFAPLRPAELTMPSLFDSRGDSEDS